MDELISKRAVIEAIEKARANVGHNLERSIGKSIIEILDKVGKDINRLPPADEPSQVARDIARIVENEQDMRVIAQSEKRTEERTETHACDLISRQVLALWNKYKSTIAVDAIEYDGELKRLLSTNLAEVGTDCISRRQAIDAATSSTMEWDGMYVQDLNGRIREAIEQLPPIQPAEPQIIRCKDCNHYKYGMCMKICANKSTNGFCDWGER